MIVFYYSCNNRSARETASDKEDNQNTVAVSDNNSKPPDKSIFSDNPSPADISRQIRIFKTLARLSNPFNREKPSLDDTKGVDLLLTEYKENKAFYDRYIEPVPVEEIQKYMDASDEQKSVMIKTNSYPAVLGMVAALAATYAAYGMAKAITG